MGTAVSMGIANESKVLFEEPFDYRFLSSALLLAATYCDYLWHIFTNLSISFRRFKERYKLEDLF